MKKPNKKERNSAKKQLMSYKTFNKIMVGVVFVMMLAVTGLVVAYLYLQFQHEQLVILHNQYVELSRSAFEKSMIWQMDASCSSQFAASDKLHLMIEKLKK
jgi:hypothetical protein